jgi:hypothetical protein
LLALLAAMLFLGACSSEPPPPPPQPLAYSHTPHVVDGEMPCTRCHIGAERGPQAGLAPVSLCVRCHRRQIPDHPEIVKMMEIYESGEPIRWRKVNVMPTEAGVHFHHGAHAAAEVGCETCHGDISQMALARQVIDVADMGWCVDCHRENDASTDCLTCHH